MKNKIVTEEEAFSRIDRWRIGRKKICATVFCDNKAHLEKTAKSLLKMLNRKLNEFESEWELKKIFYDDQEKVNKAVLQHKDIDMNVAKGKFEISIGLWSE